MSGFSLVNTINDPHKNFLQRILSLDLYVGMAAIFLSIAFSYYSGFTAPTIIGGHFLAFIILLLSFYWLKKDQTLLVSFLVTLLPSLAVCLIFFVIRSPLSSLLLIPLSINGLIFFPSHKLLGKSLAVVLSLLGIFLWSTEASTLALDIQAERKSFLLLSNIVILFSVAVYKVILLLVFFEFEHKQQKRSERRLREFLTYSSEGIFNIRFKKPISLKTDIEQQIEDIRSNGHIQECNDAFAKLYGLKSAVQIQGKSIQEINDTLWRNSGDFYYEQFAASGYKTSQTNVPYFNLQKEKKYISQSIVGIIKDMQLRGIWGIQQDITERVEAKNTLIQNEEYLKTVLNSLRDSIWSIDNNCKLTGFNDHWIKELFEMGYLPPKIGESALDYAIPQKIGYWIEWYEQALSGQHIEENLEYLIHGQPHHCLVTITPIFDESREVIGAVVYAKDITKIKVAQDKLRQSEERYRTIFENSRLGICTSQGMKITRVNPAFASMTGYSTTEIVGASPTILISEDQHLELQKVIDNLKFGIINSAEFELQFTCKDGSLLDGYVQMRGVYDTEGKYKESITTITNISKIKEANKALEEKNRSLEKYIESNMQLENFAYLASHDLKAPIRTILSFTQILNKKLQDRIDAKEQQHLDYIMKGAKGMDQLVRNLLEYSKVNSQKTTKDIIRVGELLESVLDDLSVNIQEANAELILCHVPHAIFGDYVQIRQLFQNLIANAIKFRKKDEQLYIEIKACEEEKYWRFAVKDNGIGIDKSFHDKIFQLFRKLHGPKDYEGTGIGLALCKKIVEAHGGEIFLDSSLGEGTTFSFTISKQ